MDANVKKNTTDKEDDGDEVPQVYNYCNGVLYPSKVRFFRPGDDEKLKKTIEPTSSQAGAKKSRVSYDHDDENLYVDDEEKLQKALSYSIQPQPDSSNQVGAKTSRFNNQMEDGWDSDTNMLTISSDDDNYDDDELQRVILLSMSSFNSEKQQRKPDRKLKGIAASPVLEPLLGYTFNEFSPPPRGEASTSSYVNLSVCATCGDHQPPEKMLKVFDCKHRFCRGCAHNTLYGLIKSDIFKATCPDAGCNAVCDLQTVFQNAPPELQRRWYYAYKETEALEKHVWLQCPYFRCEKKFTWDCRSMIKACPDCGALLCVTCRVSYHNHFGLTCAEYQAREQEQKLEKERQRHIDRFLAQGYTLALLRRRGEGDENEAVDEEEEEDHDKEY